MFSKFIISIALRVKIHESKQCSRTCPFDPSIPEVTPCGEVLTGASGIGGVVFDLVLGLGGAGDGRDKVDAILLADAGEGCNFKPPLFPGLNAFLDSIRNSIALLVHESPFD
jgi:hypothetical protein